ncbi:MAG: cyclic pyranopterin monophosphate synthase MoaC [Candidatus Eremiobacteraeota bacterium]|nr:cyclic pyranopterin monophosphate synthase MoaC [Candidatus Eremiobacteraeota bacterium]
MAARVKKATHIAADGGVTMVDVSHKPDTARSARAEAFVTMSAAARKALQAATLPKGDAFVAAQLAGIAAAKQTATLIPLAHALPLSSVDVALHWVGDALRIEARARTVAATGVEMEALVAAAIAALTIYDMSKALDKSIAVESVRLIEKQGGKSGGWVRSDRKKGRSNTRV